MTLRRRVSQCHGQCGGVCVLCHFLRSQYVGAAYLPPLEVLHDFVWIEFLAKIVEEATSFSTIDPSSIPRYSGSSCQQFLGAGLALLSRPAVCPDPAQNGGAPRQIV